MPKKKPVRKLTKKELEGVMYTVEYLYKRMDRDEKKIVLKTIGLSKNDIEKLDEAGLLSKVKEKYQDHFKDIDMNNFTPDVNYKKGLKYCSKKFDKDVKKEIQTEIENYKKL